MYYHNFIRINIFRNNIPVGNETFLTNCDNVLYSQDISNWNIYDNLAVGLTIIENRSINLKLLTCTVCGNYPIDGATNLGYTGLKG